MYNSLASIRGMKIEKQQNRQKILPLYKYLLVAIYGNDILTIYRDIYNHANAHTDYLTHASW